MKNERALREAIATLEQQADILGEAALAAAIAPLKAQLDEMRADGWRAGHRQRLRLVTVLFCDVVGSTEMAQQLDPEEIHAVLDPALAKLSEVIDAHGGRVLQYAGDSLLAVFGADIAMEEDPRFAVRAGLAMLDTANDLAQNLRLQRGVGDFAIRVGIHTGRVLLGAGVDRHNSIRGMPVNVAARMEQSAPKGALRISHSTYRLVRGVFDVVAQPPIPVKGVDQPVRSYLVRAERKDAIRSVSRGIDGLEVRLIGRQTELKRLQDALHRVNKGAANAPQMVVISGEAGMGKSRLADEFELWAATREPGCVLLAGRALEQTRHQANGLLRDIFLSWCRIRGSDTAVQASEKFKRTLTGLFEQPPSDDLALLGHAIGLDTGERLAESLGNARVVRERAFRAATQCIERLIVLSARPAALILDDLHWADDDSLAWLEQLLASATGWPLLVLGMTRPELFQRRADWPKHDTSHVLITLHPLATQACAGLVDELLRRLDRVPAPLRDQLVAAADGNPFYLEERVKILLDDGAIVSDGETWRLAPDRLSMAHLPDTLTGLLQARLDRLNPAERRALRQAATVGFVFWDEALAAIDPDAPAQLDALAGRELIVRQADSTLDGARQYAFHHHTLHRVARDGVLKGDRVTYNRRVGEWLEQRTLRRPGEFHGRIALHFQRGDQAQRALHHYLLGAEAAVARHSRETVLNYTDHALGLVQPTDRESLWRLHSAREAMLATTDDREGHDRDLAALQQVADAMDDDRKRAVASWRRALSHSSAGRYPDALAAAEAAATLAERCGDEVTASAIAGVRAVALRRLNDFDRARDVAERGLAQARASGSTMAEKELVYSLAALAAESGQLDESSGLARTYLELARDTGDQSAEAIGENLIGDSYYRLGDLDRARQHLERSVTLAKNLGYVYVECIAALNLVLVANGQGRFDAAVTFGRAATDIAVRSGSSDLEAVALLQLGIALDGIGDRAQARQILLNAAERYVANGSAHLQVETDSALAHVALGAGDIDEAARRVDRVIDHLDGGGSLDGTEDPLRIRWHCFEVLAALDDTRADAWLADSVAVLDKRADQIREPFRREAYRTSTLHHAALSSAWAARARI